MKKMNYIAVAVAIFCCTGLHAQNQGMLTLKINYAAGVPLGSFKETVANTSWKGFGAELMYHINDAISIGLETGSQDFNQKNPRQLYKAADGSDISAVLSNAVTTVPILLKAQVNFLQHHAVQPFAALASGGNIIAFNQYAGAYSNDAKTKFGFALRPEAGVYLPFGKYSHAGVSLGAGYNFMPFNYGGISNLNNLTARIGISFPLGQ